jgi:hypothetical protein
VVVVVVTFYSLTAFGYLAHVQAYASVGMFCHIKPQKRKFGCPWNMKELPDREYVFARMCVRLCLELYSNLVTFSYNTHCVKLTSSRMRMWGMHSVMQFTLFHSIPHLATHFHGSFVYIIVV